MKLKYWIFVAAVTLGIALAPAAFARAGGGGGGGMHGGGFAGGVHGGFHVGGVRDGFPGSHRLYGSRGGFIGHGPQDRYYPYYPSYIPDGPYEIPGYCSAYPNDYNPGAGCYYWYDG